MKIIFILKAFISIILLTSVKISQCKPFVPNNDKEMDEIDFKTAAKAFCIGKSRNFCSEEMLKIMFQIEEERQKRREMERQMKRMLFKITKIVFDI